MGVPLQQLAGILLSAGVIDDPTPTNNQLVLWGDSRSNSSTFEGGLVTTRMMQTSGYAPWLLAATGYRVEIVGNYSVPGQDLWFNRDQLSGLPGAGSSVYRGNLLSASAGGTLTDDAGTNPGPTTAGGILFLAGVNGVNGARLNYTAGNASRWEDQAPNQLGTKPFFDQMFSAFDAANKIYLVANEMPNGDLSGGQGTVAHLERRQKLDAYPAISNKMVKVNTWDAMSSTPGANSMKPGYADFDGIHTSVRGSYALAVDGWAPTVNRVYRNFPVRNQLPTAQQQATWLTSELFSAGTVAMTNVNGAVLAGGMTGSRSANAGLTVDCSRGTGPDGFPELVFRVYGTGTAAAGTIHELKVSKLLNCGSAASPLNPNSVTTSDGDRIFTIARMAVDAGNVGFMGCGAKTFIGCGFTDGTANANIQGSGAENGYFNYSADLGGIAFDYAFMSQPAVIPAKWATVGTSRLITGGLSVYYRADRAIDFTVRIGRFGIIKNR